MTMHLVQGMSSLSTKKRRANKKPGWQEAKAKHDAWLKKMGAHPDQLKAKKSKEKKSYVFNEAYNRTLETESNIKTSNNVSGYAPLPKRKIYTGTLIKGIATMHKSNAVPVINDDDAKEIARMRRG